MNKALIVGINKYASPGMNLRGCVNDARDMTEILITHYGFRQENIKVLIDEYATKQAILKNLKAMVVGAVAGDKLAFFHSGHGSQIRDVNGDEKDRYDEVLCPHDMNWDKGLYILDDDLYEIFKLLPEGVTMTTFFDSCHSGTMTKEAPGKDLAKFIYPPTFSLAFQKKAKVHRIGQKAASNPNVISLSGCTSKQYSMESNINGTYRGAFTYYLTESMRELGADTPKKKLTAKLRNSLKANKYSQKPQLECVGKVKKTPFFAE